MGMAEIFRILKLKTRQFLWFSLSLHFFKSLI
jgi:hypothetical protein